MWARDRAWRPMGGLAAVVRADQRVGAAVEAVRVVVPDPHVQGDQVRVPEVEAGAGLRAALGALILRAGEPGRRAPATGGSCPLRRRRRPAPPAGDPARPVPAPRRAGATPPSGRRTPSSGTPQPCPPVWPPPVGIETDPEPREGPTPPALRHTRSQLSPTRGWPMELGVALPTSGRLASPANIVRIAQEAERLGYAAVWTYERLLRPMAELPSRTAGRRSGSPRPTGWSTSRWRRSATSPP